MPLNNSSAEGANPIWVDPLGDKSQERHAAPLEASTGKSWKSRVMLRWLGLVLVMPLVLAASDYLAASDRGGVRVPASRIGWYFRSGQWHADVRSLAAAFRYLMSDDSDTPEAASSHATQWTTPASPENWDMQDGAR